LGRKAARHQRKEARDDEAGRRRFVPNGKESVTYTFVGNTAPFEADDDHRFDLQWQSPTGARITLHKGVVNLVFQAGTQSCS
jgi:hypothetical protein